MSDILVYDVDKVYLEKMTSLLLTKGHYNVNPVSSFDQLKITLDPIKRVTGQYDALIIEPKEFVDQGCLGELSDVIKNLLSKSIIVSEYDSSRYSMPKTFSGIYLKKPVKDDVLFGALRFVIE